MPKFSKSLKMKTFKGHQIPASSTKAVLGSMSGVYFHWKGRWQFKAINGFYVEADGFSSAHYGNNEIVEFK